MSDEGADDGDWGEVQLGEASTDPLPATMRVDKTVVKNDPEDIKKVKARITKTVGDFVTAKMKIREALDKADTKLQTHPDDEDCKILTRKLGGSVETIQESIAFWEDYKDIEHADLKSLRTKIKADIEKVNDYMGKLKVLG